MLKLKSQLFVFTVICIVITGIGTLILGGIEEEQLQLWLKTMGIYAPIIYIFIYTLGTLLILPSTPLNITGGAFFGIWWGTLWTTIAAIFAAVVSFAFTRSMGKDFVNQKLAGKWEILDQKMCQGGTYYIIAIRLLPIIPYGLVNFAAGLTSISFKQYLIGTAIGTLPGVLPFVMMGAGINQLSQGNITPIVVAITLIGMLIGTTTILKSNHKI